MKKLRFFGLLVTLVLLAFSLTVGCSNDTTSSSPGGSTTYSVTKDGKAYEVIFGSPNGPAKYDTYEIKVDGETVSSGTSEVREGGVVAFKDKDGTEFYGTIFDGTLTVTNIPGLSDSAASIQATKGGGGSVTDLTPKVITYTAVADGSAGASNSTYITVTFSKPPTDALSLDNFSITDGSGEASVDKTGNLGFDFTNTEYTLPVNVTKQGIVNFKVSGAGIDTTVRKVPVYHSLGATFAASSISLVTGVGGIAGNYYTLETKMLKIEFSGAMPGFELQTEYIGYNLLPGAYGTPAVTMPTKFTPYEDGKIWYGDVTVTGQGWLNISLT